MFIGITFMFFSFLDTYIVHIDVYVIKLRFNVTIFSKANYFHSNMDFWNEIERALHPIEIPNYIKNTFQ